MTKPYTSYVPYDWKTRKNRLDLPFPTSEYRYRIKRIRRAMQTKGLDALLVFGDAGDPGDLVYLSNFIPFGRAALIVPIEGEPMIITDAILHGEPINSFAWMTWVEDFRPVHHVPSEFASVIADALSEMHARNVGLVGADNLPISIWRELEPRSKVTLVDFWSEFTLIKSVRSDREVSLLKEVGGITARAMRAAVESIEVGKSESQIAAVASGVLIEEGAHDRAFQTIVNSGPKSGVKHGYPTQRKVKRGDMIYLDMGATKFGYQSDMSRTIVVGGADAEQKRVLDVVENAFRTLGGMMRPGVSTSHLIEKAEELARGSGLRERYRGRIYLGLMVHHAIATSFFEFPSLGLPDTVLKKNMSFAFEPMAHILDFGTAVIEDTVLITGSGVESLTPYEIVHW